MSKVGSRLYGPSNVFERLFSLFIDIVQNRLKILSLELREEKIHFIQIFIMATITVFLAVLTFGVAIATVIFALAEEYRLIGLIVATGVFLLSTLILVIALSRKLSRHPIPFTHALSELTGGREKE